MMRKRGEKRIGEKLKTKKSPVSVDIRNSVCYHFVANNSYYQ